MDNRKFKVKTKVWIYDGKNPWYFVTIPKSIATDIKRFDLIPKRGFGSIKVSVTIGKTSWGTSIFPEKQGTYVLPLKKEIRIKENLKVGKEVAFTIKLM